MVVRKRLKCEICGFEGEVEAVKVGESADSEIYAFTCPKCGHDIMTVMFPRE